MCAADSVSVWVKPVRELGALERIESVVAEDANSGNIVAMACFFAREAHAEGLENQGDDKASAAGRHACQILIHSQNRRPGHQQGAPRKATHFNIAGSPFEMGRN